jgi:hypothetical protein
MLVFYKIVVVVVARCFSEHKNWYIVKFKRANERLDLQFLWRLVDAHFPEILLYIFLYLKIYKFEHPVSSDMIGVFIFVAIYLFYMVYTNLVLIMFMKRLTPTLLTEDEAKAKNLYDPKDEESEKTNLKDGKKEKDLDNEAKKDSAETGKKQDEKLADEKDKGTLL